jgi:carbon monoxide dehydrogenase subunit G
MEIEGTYTLQASTEDVWQCLMDQQTIQHAIPGLERLNKVDEHTYTFAIHIRHAPLRGAYTGSANVLEPEYPTAYRLNIEGEGPTSKFHCECAIHLSEQGENTVVSYQGALQLGRGNVFIPAPLVKATMRVLLQHFFTTLTDQLRTVREGPVYVTTLEEMYDMPFMEEQTSEQLFSARQGQPLTLLHRLVHLLRLGNQNPVQEELWVRRLRQFGIVAVLLLLVWVGTRLPRRPVS